MTDLAQAFLNDLKSKEKLSVAEYAKFYTKHSKLAIEHEEQNGASKHQAKAMGNYYTVTVLSNFVKSDHLLNRILAFKEKV